MVSNSWLNSFCEKSGMGNISQKWFSPPCLRLLFKLFIIHFRLICFHLVNRHLHERFAKIQSYWQITVLSCSLGVVFAYLSQSLVLISFWVPCFSLLVFSPLSVSFLFLTGCVLTPKCPFPVAHRQCLFPVAHRQCPQPKCPTKCPCCHCCRPPVATRAAA